MSSPTPFRPALAAIAILVAVALGGARPAAAQDRAAEDALTDASLRLDGEALRREIDRLERRLEGRAGDARTHYLAALGHFNVVLSPLAQADMESEALRRHLAAGVEHATKAEALDAGLTDAALVKAMCRMMEISVDQSCAAANAPEVQSILERVAEAVPSDGHLAFVRTMMAVFGGAASVEALGPLEAAVERARQRLAGDGGARADWWDCMSLAFLAQTRMSITGDTEDAGRLVREVLRWRPDFAMARDYMLPATAAHDATGLDGVPSGPWTELATDGAGDGLRADLADGRALRYRFDRASGVIWFRVDLHALPDPDRFGVNLVVDADRDRATGTKWWGGASDFTFDRIVTVWVSRGGDGRYYGTVGVGDADGAKRRLLLGVQAGGVHFAIDRAGPAIVVGVPARLLDDDGAMDVLGAVGSNVSWNDDVGEPAGVSLGES